MQTHLIFIIQAYQGEDPTGNISDVVTIELIDETPEKAIARAKQLIKKKFYRVSSIIEHEIPPSPYFVVENQNGAN